MNVDIAVAESMLRINNHGGIVIDGSLVIDGHESSCERIVTHIHSDHTVRLSDSLRRRQRLIGTPLTLEWISIMNSFADPTLHNPLNYGQRYRLGKLRITLKKAVHIPGTAQVLVEHEDGITIGYTSDFKKVGWGTEVLQPDILIMDAVYGHPSYVREFDDFIETVLADLVNELLSRGPVHVYAYYGKVQEVMQVLRERGVIAPFILNHKQYTLTRTAERHGMRFGDYFHIDSREGGEVLKDGWYVYLTHSTSYSKLKGNAKASHVMLSGWEFTRPYRRIDDTNFLVAFSDHSDFRGLVEYVENSKPKVLIVNSARSSQGRVFADYVASKLGIKAILL
ncbi:MAG: MBL fold metallo-hydrolase [Zestosphaera sp.]